LVPRHVHVQGTLDEPGETVPGLPAEHKLDEGGVLVTRVLLAEPQEPLEQAAKLVASTNT
jgi:hypothetical protein